MTDAAAIGVLAAFAAGIVSFLSPCRRWRPCLAAQAQWVLDHKPQVALVWKHLEGLGLNLEQLRADMIAPEIARMIAQDLEDTRVLNVTKTPKFFVNGKPPPSFGYDPLKELVDKALASAR